MVKIIEHNEVWENDNYYIVILLDDNDNYIGKSMVEHKAKNETYCSLYHIYINENHRGKGYFRKLIELNLKNIKKNGYTDVGLYSKKELIPIYEEYGFIFESKEVNGEYAGYLDFNNLEYTGKMISKIKKKKYENK